MSCLGTLVPEGPWCVFVLCNIASSSLRSDTVTHNVIFYHNLMSHTQNIHTHTKTQHFLEPVDWHTHANAYLHHLLCVCSSYLYYTELIIIYQNFTFHNVFSFKNYALVKVIYLLIKYWKTSFFLKTQIMLIEMV